MMNTPVKNQLIEGVLDKARIHGRKKDIAEYEHYKRLINVLDLDYKEYEQAMRKLADILRI